MKDYSKGKIYKIEGGGLTYVGSTVQKLCNRMTGHRRDMKQGKNCSSIRLKNTTMLTESKNEPTVENTTPERRLRKLRKQKPKPFRKIKYHIYIYYI